MEVLVVRGTFVILLTIKLALYDYKPVASLLLLAFLFSFDFP